MPDERVSGACQKRESNQDEQDFSRVADNYSASIKQSLSVVRVLENMLQEKRERIEEIQTRHEDLAREYRQLGRTLDSLTLDLAQLCSSVIDDLRSDDEIAKPDANNASAPTANSDSAPQRLNFLPIPKFFSDARKPSEEDDCPGSRRTDPKSVGWWNHGKKVSLIE